MAVGRSHSTAAQSAVPEELQSIPSLRQRRGAPVAATWALASAAGGSWRRWSTGSNNRRIFAAMVVIGISTAAVKAAALAKELMVAASFGTTDAMDAFLMAFVLPSFAITLAGHSFSGALVPTYIEVGDRRGKAAADEMLSSTVVIGLGLLSVVTLLLAVLGPQVLSILASGFDDDKLALTRRLFYIMLPCILLSGIGSIWSSVLNAGERFALGELASVAIPLTTGIALVVAGDRWGITALALGFIAGFVAQVVLLAWGGKRAGIPLLPRWYGLTPDVRRVIGQYLPIVGGGGLLAMSPLIDQAMAATLDSGSVATLGYGTRGVDLILTLGSLTVGTAVLPYLSRMVAAGDLAAVRHTLKVYSWLILLVTIPVAVALVVLSPDIVRIFLERGAFSTADTQAVSTVQAMFALQIPFYVLSILFIRLISAMKANHILMIGTSISFVLNLSLNIVLKELMGVAGIALSSSLVNMCLLAFLAVMLNRTVRREGSTAR